MQPVSYSFLDVAILDEVRERFAAGDALAILSTDLEQVIWANGPGAVLFGYADIVAAMGASPQLGFATKRQIAATSGFPAIGRDRTIMVRMTTGMSSRAVMFQASAVTMPDGETAILLASPAATGGARSDSEIAARAISGFNEAGHFVAFVDGKGAIEAASPGFVELGISSETMAGLVARLANGASRIAKRMVPGRNRALPAGMVRLTDDRHLVVVIDEGEPAESTPAVLAAAEPAQAAEPPVEAAAADISETAAVEAALQEDAAPAEPAGIVPHPVAEEDATQSAPASLASEELATVAEAPGAPETASGLAPDIVAATDRLGEAGDAAAEQLAEAVAGHEAFDPAGEDAAPAEPETTAESAPDMAAATDQFGGAGDAAVEQLAAAVAGHEAFDPAGEDAAERDRATAEHPEAAAKPASKSDHDSWYFSRAEDSPQRSLASDETSAGAGETQPAQPIAADEPAQATATSTAVDIEADTTPVDAGPLAEVEDSPTAEAATDEAQDIVAAERAGTQAATAAIAPKIDRASAPVRFVWRTDAEGKFSQISPEFGDVVGASAAAVIGRGFQDIADTFALDPSGEIAGLLARRDTWSGRSVLWPVAGTDLKIPVDLAALPVYGRDRNFEGFRGFGVARAADAVVDPEAIGLGLVAGPDSAGEIAPTPLSPANDAAKAADPFRGEVPALSIVPQPDRRFADKVIRLAEHRQPANDKGLSTGERIAFQQIGERLKKESGPEAAAQPSKELPAATEPVASPSTDAGQAEELDANAAVAGAAPPPEPADDLAAAEDTLLGPAEAEVEGEGIAELLALDGAEQAADLSVDGAAPDIAAPDSPAAGSGPVSPLAGKMSAEPTEGSAVPPMSPHDDEEGHSTLPPSVLPAPTRGEIGQSPDDTAAEPRKAEPGAAEPPPVAGSHAISPLVGEMSPLATEGGAVPPTSPQDIEEGRSTLPPSAQPAPARGEIGQPDEAAALTIEAEPTEGRAIPPASSQDDQEGRSTLPASALPAPARAEIGQSPTSPAAAETRAAKPARSGMSLLDFAQWDQDDEAAAPEIAQSAAEVEIASPESAAAAEIAGASEASQAAAEMTAATDAELQREPVTEAVEIPAETPTELEIQPVVEAESSQVETQPDAESAIPAGETAGDAQGMAGQPGEAIQPPAAAAVETDTAAADAASRAAPAARPLPANDALPPADVAAEAPATETKAPAEAWRAVAPRLKTAGFVPSALASAQAPKRSDTSILEKLPVPVLVHAGDTLHYANAEFFAFTGYSSVEELADAGGIGALFVDPYDDEETPERTDRQLRLKDRAGAEFPVEAFLQSVPWNGGKALLLVLARASDRALGGASASQSPLIAELEARVAEMRTIIDTATDGVVLISRDGTIRSISRPAEALFSFDSDEVAGKPFASLFAIESQRAARDYLAGLSDHGVASVLNDGREVIGREAEGRFIPLFMTIGKLPADSGYCAVVRDITQWKRAEEELTQARAVAERASSHKSDFLARISHEIRTPLNAIIGFSELMVDEKFGPVANDRYRDYLRDINRSGNHVLDLVNDLLDISKIEAGQQEMAYEAVSLNDTLAETVAMMQPQANRERVIIRSSFASKLPDVVADLRSVRQIALNILSNAVRYTQAGGQVIVSTAYETSGDVVMRVRDTGIGMSQAEIEQALKPFKQINSLKRARGDGTGLGLPLTKAMVEANRARFTINSTPGEGTLVEISFPSTRVLAE